MSLELSVVIPIHDESPNLDDLYRELTATLDAWGRTYELLFVDDGSTDDSFAILARLHRDDPRVRVVQFRRNFGQTAAFAAGFARARGRLIVTADGDLQNDPRDIPAMIKRLEDDDLDIVCGWRKNRQDAWLSRKLPSNIANRLISWATGVHLNDYGCSLKVFRAEVVKPLRLYGELHRFIPALASEMGVKIAEQAVHHRPRRHGRSKYGIGRTIRVVLDLLTVKFLVSYSTRPLQVFGLYGIVMGGAGVLVCAYVAYLKYFTAWSGDRTWLLLLGILFVFTGVQLVTLGLLAEMQARTYHESQGKPVYSIRRVLDAEPLAVAGPLDPRISDVYANTNL
ncbi:MAG: glycosyltransferase family 2 protein [Acidobacteria bacterium]|nr:glycosyltransferase family 2 protein [Acidobacteriota bacterium]